MDNGLVGRKRGLFRVMLVGLAALLVLLAYAAIAFVRGMSLYDDVKWSGQGFIGHIFVPAPRIGYVPAPGASGAFAIPLGMPIPVHHDDAGLRAPLGVRHSLVGMHHPRLLFLGCSFTYGQMVPAEATFANRTAVRLGGGVINGGVPGYSLAQMVLRAHQLIPAYRPDYVVVQYSPWLVDRAITEFAPSYNQLVVPVPYYSGEGPLTIADPAFEPYVPDLDRFRVSPVRFGDRLRFFWQVALPMYVHDDARLLVFRARQFLGISPVPTQNRDEVVRTSYAEINEVARRNGAQVVILALGTAEPLITPDILFPPGVVVVDGQQALLDHLPQPTRDEYVKAYWHWRGNPLRPVDWHPNEHAHELLASALVSRLQQLQLGHGPLPPSPTP